MGRPKKRRMEIKGCIQVVSHPPTFLWINKVYVSIYHFLKIYIRNVETLPSKYAAKAEGEFIIVSDL